MKYKNLIISSITTIILLSFLGACGDVSQSSLTNSQTSKSQIAVSTTSSAGGTSTPALTVASNQGASASQSQASTTNQDVILALSYIPNVQFAPVYVAQDKGYFGAEGLKVGFQYGTISDLMALVAQGKIPFAFASGDEVLQARAQGFPVVYVTSVYQKYPVALASLKSKGITRPSDLKGKTIGIPGPFGATYIGLKAILAAGNLSEADVKIQSIGFTQREALAQGKVDAAMVYSMNEPVQLQKAGVQIDLIDVSTIINLASVGIITGEDTINSNPALVQKMVRAVTKGIRDTIGNPDAAFESTIKVAPDAKGDDPELQRQVLKATARIMVSDNVKGQSFGYSDPKVWEASSIFLFENKLLKNKTAAQSAYTNKFVDAAEAGKYS